MSGKGTLRSLLSAAIISVLLVSCVARVKTRIEYIVIEESEVPYDSTYYKYTSEELVIELEKWENLANDCIRAYGEN